MKLTGGLGSTGMVLIFWGWGNETTLLGGYVTTLCLAPDKNRLLGGLVCPTLVSITGLIVPKVWPVLWKLILVLEPWVGFGEVLDIITG